MTKKPKIIAIHSINGHPVEEIVDAVHPWQAAYVFAAERLGSNKRQSKKVQDILQKLESDWDNPREVDGIISTGIDTDDVVALMKAVFQAGVTEGRKRAT